MGHSSISGVRKHLQKSLEVLERSGRNAAGEPSEKDEDEILHRAELVAMAMRERKEERDSQYREPMKKSVILDTAMVSLRMEHGYLTVRTPHFVNRRRTDSWYLSGLVYEAVYAHVRAGGWHPAIDSRFYLAFVRYCSRKPNRIFDNDNVEAHTVADALVRGMGMDDNPLRVQFLFTTILTKSREDCCVIYLVPEEEMHGFLAYLHSHFSG